MSLLSEGDPDDIRAAYKKSSCYLDRFRDVVAEVTGQSDNNPGDDVLIAELRSMHGKTGPEPRRWRDFLVGAVAQLDQIDAMRKSEDVRPPDAT